MLTSISALDANASSLPEVAFTIWHQWWAVLLALDSLLCSALVLALLIVGSIGDDESRMPPTFGERVCAVFGRVRGTVFAAAKPPLTGKHTRRFLDRYQASTAVLWRAHRGVMAVPRFLALVSVVIALAQLALTGLALLPLMQGLLWAAVALLVALGNMALGVSTAMIDLLRWQRRAPFEAQFVRVILLASPPCEGATRWHDSRDSIGAVERVLWRRFRSDRTQPAAAVARIRVWHRAVAEWGDALAWTDLQPVELSADQSSIVAGHLDDACALLTQQRKPKRRSDAHQSLPSRRVRDPGMRAGELLLLMFLATAAAVGIAVAIAAPNVAEAFSGVINGVRPWLAVAAPALAILGVIVKSAEVTYRHLQR
jgi:hypothetical protein